MKVLLFWVLSSVVISSMFAGEVSNYPLAAHPRLLATSADFEVLKTRLKTDPVLQKWYTALKKEADKLVGRPPYKYELRDGVRLLMVSRDVLRAVTTLAVVYKVDGGKQYLDRAWKEMENVSNFQDWHPVHFLDVAEMTNAMALGYDWLYGDLTPEQRALVRGAITRKGLDEALKVYDSHKGWPLVVNNWNFVCNGGITLGALAIADEDAAPLNLILPLVRLSLPHALPAYAPDGAWNESPGYWEYGTSYLVYLLAGLQTALGTDFDLFKTPGLDKTGDFALAMSGPGRIFFNFGDVGSPKGWVSSDALWYLAKVFGRPEYGWARKQEADFKPTALDLLWYDPKDLAQTPDQAKLAGDRLFRRVEVATFRSSWSDPEALFAGIKGTDFPDRNHTDLDNGTLFFAALGQIWATDLGSDDYNLPGYFDMNPSHKNNRWNLYRKRAEGSNTLVINPGMGPDQITQGRAPIVSYQSGTDRSFAIVDLSAVYPGAKDVKRGLLLSDQKSRALLQDEIHLKEPGEIWWFWHFDADLKVDIDVSGTTVVLTNPAKNVHLVLKLLQPEQGLRFQLMNAEPLPTSPHINQNANTAFRKLALHASATQDLNIVVSIVPERGEGELPSPDPVFPLSEWK